MADTALHLVDRVLTVDILRCHPDVEVADPEMTAAIIVHVIEALTHKLVIHPTAGMDRDAYCDVVVSILAGYVSTAG